MSRGSSESIECWSGSRSGSQDGLYLTHTWALAIETEGMYCMAGNVLIILIMIMIMISQISGELGEKKDVATEARRWLR